MLHLSICFLYRLLLSSSGFQLLWSKRQTLDLEKGFHRSDTKGQTEDKAHGFLIQCFSTLVEHSKHFIQQLFFTHSHTHNRVSIYCYI